MKQKFWMVKGNGPTSYTHLTRRLAEEEAARLARKSPGEDFFVLETVSAVTKNEVQWHELKEPEFEQPF